MEDDIDDDDDDDNYMIGLKANEVCTPDNLTFDFTLPEVDVSMKTKKMDVNIKIVG
jgi:hypothetical protein